MPSLVQDLTPQVLEYGDEDFDAKYDHDDDQAKNNSYDDFFQNFDTAYILVLNKSLVDAIHLSLTH